MHTITIGHCRCGRGRATLIDGLCGFCDDAHASTGHLAPTAHARPMTIGAAIAALVAELEAEIALPLAQTFTLAAIASDLCRLAGEPVPAAVLAALDEPTHAPAPRLIPTDRRGSCREWREQFYEPA